MATHLRLVNGKEYGDGTLPVFCDGSSGATYACDDYEAFANACVDDFLATPVQPRHLYADWTRYDRHTLVFDLDVKKVSSVDGSTTTTVPKDRKTCDVLCRYFDLVFLDALEKHLSPTFDRIALLVAMRLDGTGGMHVHCPGIEMTHEDYLRLCDRMENDCRYRDGSLLVKLNSPSVMSLIGSDRPFSVDGGSRRPYAPVRYVHVKFGFRFDERILMWIPRKIHQIVFVPAKKEKEEDPPSSNESAYRKLYNGMVTVNESEWMKQLMPVENQSFSLVEGRYKIRLFFRTRIVSPEKWKKEEETVVARWQSFANTHHVLVKGASLEKETVSAQESDRMEGGGSSSCYRWLRGAVEDDLIRRFDVVESCSVLKTWYKRLTRQNWIPKDEMDVFRDADRILRKKCFHLRLEKSPLLTLLEDFDAFYLLPAYFALCNTAFKKFKRPAEYVAEGLRRRLEEEMDDPAAASRALQKLRDLNGLPPPAESGRLSMDTVLYCAMHAVPRIAAESSGIFLEHVGLGPWRRLFPILDSLDQATTCIRWVQTHYYPVVKGKTGGGEEEQLYAWDPFTDTWNRLSSEEEERKREIKGVLQGVVRHVTHFAGFRELLPRELIAALSECEEAWLRSMADQVLKEAQEKEAISGNALPENLTDREKTKHMEKHYGPNVPEYYFFSFRPDTTTTITDC